MASLSQGDWVWLKKFEEGHFREVRQSTTKIFTKVQQHVLICKKGHWCGIVFLLSQSGLKKRRTSLKHMPHTLASYSGQQILQLLKDRNYTLSPRNKVINR